MGGLVEWWLNGCRSVRLPLCPLEVRTSESAERASSLSSCVSQVDYRCKLWWSPVQGSSCLDDTVRLETAVPVGLPTAQCLQILPTVCDPLTGRLFEGRPSSIYCRSPSTSELPIVTVTAAGRDPRSRRWPWREDWRLWRMASQVKWVTATTSRPACREWSLLDSLPANPFAVIG